MARLRLQLKIETMWYSRPLFWAAYLAVLLGANPEKAGRFAAKRAMRIVPEIETVDP